MSDPMPKIVTVTNAADYGNHVAVRVGEYDTMPDIALRGARKLRAFGAVYGVKKDVGIAHRFQVLGRPVAGLSPVVGHIWTY